MKLPPEEFTEYLFWSAVIVSGILTTLLLAAALVRLLDADAGGLPRQP